MNQTRAIFLDAYRELNARKMFWVTLILSGLWLGLLALFSVSDDRVTFIVWSWHQPLAKLFYKNILLDRILVGVWLSWGAVILALLSTTHIFPDFVSGGTIDLYLSKPIGRLRLFLTKYAAGLLFVILQATIFAVCAFLVVGVRLGQWRPGLFLSIPLLTLLFSYLYAVCVFFGVWTRSAMAALALTLVVWLLIFGVHWGELLLTRVQFEHQGTAQVESARADRLDARLQSRGDLGGKVEGALTNEIRVARDDARREAVRAQSDAAGIAPWSRFAYAVKTILPKTSDTIGLMDRAIYTDEEWRAKQMAEEGRMGDRAPEQDQEAMDLETYSARSQGSRKAAELYHAELESRGTGWIVVTSLMFEAAVLALAAWMFCRRDY